MDIEDQNSQTTNLISVRIRWLAITVGLLMIGTIFIGWGSLVESMVLIVAAILQPRSPQLGRWLMWVSASLLSVIALPTGVALLVGGVKLLHSYHDNVILGVFSLTIIAVLLVLCLDIALVVEAVMQRQRLTVSAQSSRGGLDWVVWMAAFVLSVYYLRMSVLAVHSYRLFGRLDALITGTALALVVLLFDLSLVVKAVMGRARRVA